MKTLNLKNKLSPHTKEILEMAIERRDLDLDWFDWGDMPEMLEGHWNSGIDELIKLGAVEPLGVDSFTLTENIIFEL